MTHLQNNVHGPAPAESTGATSRLRDTDHRPPTMYTLAAHDVPTTDTRHMLDQHGSTSRKRQRSEHPHLDDKSQTPSKKQRLSHSSEHQPPAGFWDKSSNIWLTKRALRELDRRYTPAALNPPPSPHQNARRPVTRSFIAKHKTGCQLGSCTYHYLSRCTPRILKDVKAFARHGGPDLSDLRNYPEPIRRLDHTMSSSQTTQSRGRGGRGRGSGNRGSATTSSTRLTQTTTTKSSGVYDRNFQQQLVDSGVYPDLYEYPNGSESAEPANFKDIKLMLINRRPSLSPSRFSDGDFKHFSRANAYAAKEKQVSESVIPIIEGKIRDPRCRSGGIPFTNLDPLTDDTLKPGNPDIYYGACPEQLSREIRDELGGHIIPSTQHDLPMVPNFFLAAKGPDGSLAVAGRQACYDGALGARGMHTLRSYQQEEPCYDNNADTITSIYHGGTLKMYTSHLAQPRNPGRRPECYMHQLGGWSMTGDVETFRQGAKAYRNAREWAETQRDEAIKQANERANPVETETPAGDAPSSPALSFVTAVSETEPSNRSQESSTSLDKDSIRLDGLEESEEDLSDYTIPAKRSNKHSEDLQSRRKRHNVGGTDGQSEDA